MRGVVLHESANPVASVAFGVADGFVQFDYAQCVRCEEVGQPRIRCGHDDTSRVAGLFSVRWRFRVLNIHPSPAATPTS